MGGNFLAPTPQIIATWPKPNYVDPERRGWMPEFAITWQVLATILVATRLWLRFKKHAGPLGLDDALLIPAYLGSVMLTTTNVLASERYGSDRHVWDVPYELFPDALLIAWLSEVAFLVSTTSTKISVLLFYRRLVKGTYDRKWFWAILAGIVFTAGVCVGMIIALLVCCQPTRAYWLSADYFGWAATHEYNCADTRSLNILSGILSVVTDFYAVVLPVLMLRNFNAPKAQKIALFVLFSLGLIVVAAGCVRTYYLNELSHTYDLTWEGFDLYVWAQLECQLALIIACVPATRVLFRKYLSGPVSRVRGTFRTATTTSTVGGTANRDAPVVSDKLDAKNSVTVDMESNGDEESGVSLRRSMSHKRVASPYGDSTTEWPISTSPMDWTSDVQIRTPKEYEEYNMAVIDKHRHRASHMS